MKATNLKKFGLPRAETGQVDAEKGHCRAGKGLYARLLWAEQSLKRYMASGLHCPIGLHLVNGRCDGAAAPVGADDLWYHTGQS